MLRAAVTLESGRPARSDKFPKLFCVLFRFIAGIGIFAPRAIVQPQAGVIEGRVSIGAAPVATGGA